MLRLLYLTADPQSTGPAYDDGLKSHRTPAMRSPILTLFVLTACGLASAQEFGHVVSSTPVVQQVAIPQQVCRQESVLVPQSQGGGAVIGAITGGAIGNSIGQGAGRALGTMIGIVGGAIVGDRIESHGGSQVQQVQRCSTHMALENRVLHYDVVYEYAGRQYAVRLAHDPGPTVLLQLRPVDTVAPPPIEPAPVMLEAPSITHIYSGVYYQPYLTYQAPAFIAITPRLYGRPSQADFGPRGFDRPRARHPGERHNHYGR